MSSAKSKYITEHVHKDIDVSDLSHDSDLIERLLKVGKQTPADVLDELKTNLAGLHSADARVRLKKYGWNEIAKEKPVPWWQQLFQAFVTPFTLILLSLAAISYFTDVVMVTADKSWAKVIIIGSMVLLSGSLRFWQEFRSQKAAQELRRLVQNKATVLRSHTADQSKKCDIPVSHLVPGDIVHLAAGDMIPADVRVIESDDLYISQSALTGESMPAPKFANLGSNDKKLDDPLELGTLCFTGTNVVSGTAMAVVVATGHHTYLGALAKQVTAQRPMTSFDKGVNSVGLLLVRFMLVMVPVVFLINGLTKGDWQSAFLFAVAVAVGLTPELLAVVVTANLAKGAVRMARKKVIIKKLNAIQNFGAMDVLCTDKTGTLTENRIALVQHLDTEGGDSKRVLDLAYINSSLQTGLKSLMDEALIAYCDGSKYKHHEYKRTDEIPFDFSRRRMSVIVEDKHGKKQLICKGAVEELLDISTKVEQPNGKCIDITNAHRKRILQLVDKLNNDGLRVLAVGYKNLNAQKAAHKIPDESSLTLTGFIAFLDPPKASAKDAVAALTAYGITLKIITGDNEVVTTKICKEVGFPVTGVLLGEQIHKMTDTQLEQAAEKTSIFAKVDPLQKARIINALRANGHTVGYMGDGVNDAAAMHQSDVGISVDGGVDIAKEAADLILLKHDLMVLADGVIQGRTVFGNIMKYIKMTVSSNFGNMFSLLIASAFLPFLPMLPIHILIQNLIYDISQFSLPWDNMDEEFLTKPRKWDAGGIAQFMVCIGPISSIFDIAMFCILWFVFGANNPSVQSLFQSGWFVAGLLTQTFIVYMIRTQKIPFVQSRPARPVIVLTTLAATVGVILPFTPVGAAVGLQALPASYFLWLLAILLSYGLVTQIAKTIYIRKTHRWL